ncbi:AMP-dependent synthetase and ligase [Xylariales sp. AK1849]|nr:AMP-dependent synthetase and ligase [Xylariales sp. AK1849]
MGQLCSAILRHWSLAWALMKSTPSSPLDPDSRPNVVQWALSGDYDPDTPILIDASDPTRSVSKREAIDWIARLAGSFQPGSVILYPVLVLSIMAGSCTWTGTNISYTASELEHHLRVSEASYIITGIDHLSTVEAAMLAAGKDVEVIIYADVLRALDPDCQCPRNKHKTLNDLLLTPSHMSLEERLRTVHAEMPASLASTSGTTGLPKMAEKTHGSLVSESMSDDLYDSDRQYSIRRLYCTPMFHAYSFPKMVINPLRQGRPTYYMKRFDDSFAKNISKYGITDTIVVPPILSRLVDQTRKDIGRKSLQSLRVIICAGAPLKSTLRKEFLDLFDEPPSLVQEWGMTECGCISRVAPWEIDVSGSVGRPVGTYQVTVDKEGYFGLSNGLPTGELLARGPQLMTHYLANPKTTAQSFAPGGWFRTGDVGYIDEDDRIHLVDRVKDIIKINGWQVSPAELEAIVLKDPRVVDTCALSMGHSLDEHPEIFIVRGRDDLTAKEIKEHLRHHLSRYKIASCNIIFVDSLPRAPSGKILRRILRKQLEEGSFNGS